MAVHSGLKFKTSVSISTIQDWMVANCKNEWDVEIESISISLHQKLVAAYFEID